jgi:PmbA protein
MNPSELARNVVDKAKRAGATGAEASARLGTEFSTSVRLGSVEKLLQSSFRKLGLRVFCGTRSAITSTSDFSEATLEAIAADAVQLAGAASEDSAAGLPEPSSYDVKPPTLELFFPKAAGLSAREKIELARRCEDAAFAYDSRISNSEGAGFSESVIHTSYANSLGIDAAYSRTLSSLFTTPLAETNGHKQRDYWLSTHSDPDRLQSPEEIGHEAARRTLRRLGARKVNTCEVPIVFDPVTAAALMKHLAEAASGTALLRKASFLLNRLGTRVAAPLVTVMDDPLLAGGVGSRPFDAEGVPSQTTCVIRDGILESYLLDSYAARKLGLRSTANSNRELHGGPSVGPSNFFLKPGAVSPDQIIASVRRGLYVTELIGFGVDIVSGNYSQGVAGQWIDKGTPAFPVEEVTIAGNLQEMLARIEAVGNDPWILGEIFAPTLLIGKMVVSGN